MHPTTPVRPVSSIRQRRTTGRGGPYVFAIGLVIAAYLGLLAITFFAAGGLDPSAYDCGTLFCSPTDKVSLIGIAGLPSTLGAAVFAALALVVLHRIGSRLYWLAEGAVGAATGIAVSAVVSFVLVQLFV